MEECWDVFRNGRPARLRSVKTTQAGKSIMSEFGLIHTPILFGRFVAIRSA
ncbi:MAG: hypothetical protein JW896_09570 [Deltaproteobacteria bacterium]|nr:hypothetical protein [Deltaproteobacteria bacterium]